MKKLTLPIIALAVASMMQSCYKDGPDHNWDRGASPEEPTVNIDPVGIDTDGDGVVDKTIEMTGDMGSETYPDGSAIDKEIYKGGSFYDPSAANNKPVDVIFEEIKKALDKDGDGKMDAAAEITETVVPSVSEKLSPTTADSVVAQLLASASVPSSSLANVAIVADAKVTESVEKIDITATYDNVALETAIQTATQEIFVGGTSADIYTEIAAAVKTATDAAVNKQLAVNASYIDEEQMQIAVQDAIAAAIQDIVQAYIQEAVQAAVIKSLTATIEGNVSTTQIEKIAADIAKVSSQNIASDLIADIASAQATAVQAAISQAIYNQSQYEPAPVQGLCADGYHVPSDREWKEIELALGMPASEVHQSGERNDRGESVGMAKKFETALDLQYGGYITADHKSAQYGEVSMFATSSVGKDATGEYVWVRYIDKMGHGGIIRKKIRKGTLMSVRCIK